MSSLSRRSAVFGSLAGLGALAAAPAAVAATPTKYPSGPHPFDPTLSSGWATNPFSGLKLNSTELAVIAATEKIQQSAPEWGGNAAVGRPVHRTVVTSGDVPPIPFVTHSAPTWYSARVSTVASGTDLLVIYVSLDWALITLGPHKGQYIATGALHRSDLPLPKPGFLSGSQIAPVPTSLRHNPNDEGGRYLNPQALKQMVWLNAAYRQFFGRGFVLNEGYRTDARQRAIYASEGPDIAATPGTSDHEMGLSADIDSVTIGGSRGSIWMNFYSPAFGWQRPAMFDRRTTEFWHYNYVG